MSELFLGQLPVNVRRKAEEDGASVLQVFESLLLVTENRPPGSQLWPVLDWLLWPVKE